jgi:Glutathione S-transferase, C-terminal domain
LTDTIRIVEGQLANAKWILGQDFTLVDCGYGPVLNVIEKAGFRFGEFPKVRAYLEAIRSRPAWKETPSYRGSSETQRLGSRARFSCQHEDHLTPGDQFPFTYAPRFEPVSGRTDGILERCRASNTCPKIMQTDSSGEFGQGRASLVVTDEAGRDIELPDDVRFYLFAGAQHEGAWPPPSSRSASIRAIRWR